MWKDKFWVYYGDLRLPGKKSQQRKWTGIGGNNIGETWFEDIQETSDTTTDVRCETFQSGSCGGHFLALEWVTYSGSSQEIFCPVFPKVMLKKVQQSVSNNTLIFLLFRVGLKKIHVMVLFFNF